MHLNRNKLIIAWILLAAVSCHSKRENPVEEVTTESGIIDIPIESSLKNEIPHLYLSEAVSSIEFIPLEMTNKSLIKYIDNIGITDEEIIVTGNRQFLRFSRDGTFLNEIGRLGNGPQEYPDAHHNMIREDHRDVYILTGTGIKVFNFDGSFKREASKTKTDDMFIGAFLIGLTYFSDYHFLRDGLPLVTPRPGIWSIALTDSMFNIQKKHYNPDYLTRAEDIAKEENCPSHTYFKNHWVDYTMEEFYGGKYKIKHIAVDTIYQFNEQSLTFDPLYTLSLGKNRPSFEEAYSWLKEPGFFKYLSMYQFYESRDFLYFLAGKDNMLYTIQYNKSNREINVKKEKTEITERRLPGSSSNLFFRRLEASFKLTNDISGGMDFTVNRKSPSGYWINICTPEDLEKIDIEKLKTEKVKDNQARDQLIKILENMSEDDNPLLIIAKLK